MTATSTTDPLVGRLVDSRYRIHERVARGGMACVYRASDTRLDRLVAVKVMHSQLADDANFAAKFEAEARAAARLSDPSVVAVFDQGNDAGRPYIVMELIRGRTLRSVISRQAPLGPTQALGLIEPVLIALSGAHQAGLIHRDVKPENVLISDQGEVKVGDFGLARAVTAQTSTGTDKQLMGTISYLSPELVTGGRADARSDVYSAGIVLFELLTGQKPHTGETPIQVAYAHVHQDVPSPSTLPAMRGAGGGDIPDYLDALVTRATARNADARPHDAQVMLTQVRRVSSALQAGVRTDPELTQDLSVPLGPLRTGGGQPDDPEETHVADARVAATPAVRSGGSQREAGDYVGDAPTTSIQTGTPESTPTQPTPFSVPARPSESNHGSVPADVRPPTARTSTVKGAGTQPVRRPRPNRPRYPSDHPVRGWLLVLIVLLLAGIATAIGWYLGSTQLAAVAGDAVAAPAAIGQG